MDEFGRVHGGTSASGAGGVSPGPGNPIVRFAGHTWGAFQNIPTYKKVGLVAVVVVGVACPIFGLLAAATAGAVYAIHKGMEKEPRGPVIGKEKDLLFIPEEYDPLTETDLTERSERESKEDSFDLRKLFAESLTPKDVLFLNITANNLIDKACGEIKVRGYGPEVLFSKAIKDLPVRFSEKDLIDNFISSLRGINTNSETFQLDVLKKYSVYVETTNIDPMYRYLLLKIAELVLKIYRKNFS